MTPIGRDTNGVRAAAYQYGVLSALNPEAHRR